MELKVQDSGNRIDKFVADKTDYTRSAIQRMIENGNILVSR